jgi:seryl-tRNA synthetase
MVRKNLSDLLKEEAQKSAQPQEITVDAQVVPEAPSEAQTNAEAPSEAQTNAESAVDRRRTSPTKAELETTLKELQTALEAVQTENNSLRSQLQDQKTLVEKVEKLQAELDQAKQTILKLTETNSKPAKQPKPASAMIRSPQPSFHPDLPSTAFTDKDIGWVD